MVDRSKAWSQPSALEFYSKHRHEASDLYPSEQVFLPRVLFPGAKVLDIGCASGGFFNIMRSMEPTIDYVGMDIVEPALELARNRYPEARFMLADGFEIPFDDGTFDLVHCTSVLNNEPRYQELLPEMYRVSNRFVLTDMRLLKDLAASGNSGPFYYDIKFEGDSQEATVPYVVNDADEVVNYLLGLEPRPQALRATGYFHTVSPMARIPFSEVCMAILLIQKGNSATDKTLLDIQDLPLDFAIDPAFT